MFLDILFFVFAVIFWHYFSGGRGQPTPTEKKIKRKMEFHWNDRYFVNNFVLKLGVRERPDLNQSVECCKAFMNWYTWGDNVCDMSLVIAGIFGQATRPESTEYLFDSSLFSVEAGQSVPLLEDVPRKVDMGSYRSELTRWYFTVFALLEKEESKKRGVINYLSYLAMTMLRCVKSPGSFTRRVERVSEEVVRFWKYTVKTIKITPPPARSVLQDSNLQRYGSYSTRMLTFVVASHGACPDSENNTCGVIFRTACLLNLRLTGMDCYRYTAEAAKSLGLRHDQIPAMIQFEKNGHFVESFLDQYVDPRADEKSWPWARLFRRDCFQQLSLEHDPMFALTMATLTPGNNVTKVLSFNKYHSQFAQASERADKIRSLLIDTKAIYR